VKYFHRRISIMTSLLKTAKNIAIGGSCARRLTQSLTFALLQLTSAAAIADDLPVAVQVIDLANKLNGPHPEFRAFHAKGVGVAGSFKTSPEAAKLRHATAAGRASAQSWQYFGNATAGAPDFAAGTYGYHYYGYSLGYAYAPGYTFVPRHN
jgi:catalase